MQETTKTTQLKYTHYRRMFNLNKHASDPWITENNRL